MKINYANVAKMMKAASGYKNAQKVDRSIYDSLVKAENAPVVFLNNDRTKPQLSATAYRQAQKDAKAGNKQAEQVLRIASAIREHKTTSKASVQKTLTPAFVMATNYDKAIPLSSKPKGGWARILVCQNGEIIYNCSEEPTYFERIEDMVPCSTAKQAIKEVVSEMGSNVTAKDFVAVKENKEAQKLADCMLAGMAKTDAKLHRSLPEIPNVEINFKQTNKQLFKTGVYLKMMGETPEKKTQGLVRINGEETTIHAVKNRAFIGFAKNATIQFHFDCRLQKGKEICRNIVIRTAA